MEDNVQANRIRLAAVVADSNDAITVQDLDGTITAWNKGAERMYGYTEAEAIGMNIVDIVPESRRMEFSAFMQRIRVDDTVESFETQRISKDHRIIDVWLTVTRLVDSFGHYDSIATTERDITAMKRREAEREQTIAALQKALAEVKTLRGLLPICASCKDIRDDKGYWQQIESYLRDHAEVEFTHGICPKCTKKLYPELFKQ